MRAGIDGRRRRMAGFAAVAATIAAIVATIQVVTAESAAADPPYTAGLPWSVVGIGNVGSGAGTNGIFWHNSDTNETRTWTMSGADLVTQTTVVDEGNRPLLVGRPWNIVGVGNIDGVGDDDLVWHDSSTNETEIWFMRNNQVLQRPTVIDESGQAILVGQPWSIVGVGDFNTDGKADLVWYNSVSNETQIWLMNGRQVLRRPTVTDESGQAILVGQPWSIVGVGDFNNDGKADLVWYNSASGETQTWWMNGTQITHRPMVTNGSGQPVSVGPPWTIVGVGNLSGNGQADILWHNSSTNETQVWFMNGDQRSFGSDVSAIPIPAGPFPLFEHGHNQCIADGSYQAAVTAVPPLFARFGNADFPAEFNVNCTEANAPQWTTAPAGSGYQVIDANGRCLTGASPVWTTTCSPDDTSQEWIFRIDPVDQGDHPFRLINVGSSLCLTHDMSMAFARWADGIVTADNPFPTPHLSWVSYGHLVGLTSCSGFPTADNQDWAS